MSDATRSTTHLEHADRGRSVRDLLIASYEEDTRRDRHEGHRKLLRELVREIVEENLTASSRRERSRELLRAEIEHNFDRAAGHSDSELCGFKLERLRETFEHNIRAIDPRYDPLDELVRATWASLPPIKITSSSTSSQGWLKLRYRALKTYGAMCQCCGCGASEANPIQVDHIKPRSKFPELALVFSNLQVLCRSCNLGKRDIDETDWRCSTKEEETI